ncbi:hypothetical protein [Catenovulum sediminis]|uniref:Uncharacterized protein n=1 Tax=Catenovulum sediminis TaxID=1740262 RepID=A0ABV1RKC8_9ALTE
MEKLMECISDAIDERQAITIIYHGGSKAGLARQITPQTINGDRLRAFCHADKVSKNFLISKIQLIENTGEIIGTPEKIIEYKENIKFEIVNDFLDHVSKIELSSPYILVISVDSVDVFKKWKNGNLQKTPILSFYYLDENYDQIKFSEIKKLNLQRKTITTDETFKSGGVDITISHTETTDANRPWRVDSGFSNKRKSTSKFAKATELFLTEIENYCTDDFSN